MRHENGAQANFALHQRHRLLQLPALIFLIATTDDAASPLFVAGATVGTSRPLAPTAHLTLG